MKTPQIVRLQAFQLVALPAHADDVPRPAVPIRAFVLVAEAEAVVAQLRT